MAELGGENTKSEPNNVENLKGGEQGVYSVEKFVNLASNKVEEIPGKGEKSNGVYDAQTVFDNARTQAFPPSIQSLMGEGNTDMAWGVRPGGNGKQEGDVAWGVRPGGNGNTPSPV